MDAVAAPLRSRGSVSSRGQSSSDATLGLPEPVHLVLGFGRDRPAALRRGLGASFFGRSETDLHRQLAPPDSAAGARRPPNAALQPRPHPSAGLRRAGVPQVGRAVSPADHWTSRDAVQTIVPKGAWSGMTSKRRVHQQIFEGHEKLNYASMGTVPAAPDNVLAALGSRAANPSDPFPRRVAGSL
jgi:hypothetical protein